MSPGPVEVFIRLVGLTTQVAGAALTALLFLMLLRHAVRDRPFRLWCAAWLTLTFALVSLLPWLGAEAAGSAPATLSLASLGLACYQLGKFAYLLLLLLGLLVFTRGIPWRRWLRWGLPVALVLGGASLLAGADLDRLLALQAPLVAVVCLTGARLLVRLPRLRRTVGTSVTAAALALLAALWTVQLVRLWGPPGGYGVTVLDWLTVAVGTYGVFGDVLLQIVLGLGMVVILFEGNMREAAAAHEELSIAHSQLERHAYLDPLTGAYNRAAFAAGRGLGLAASAYGVAVMLDLDHFKAVNDTHGHPVGDELLRHLVATLRELLRASDSIYRWGGDEFVAVLPGASAEDVSQRLARALPEAPPLRGDDGVVVPLRVSFGAAPFTSGADLSAAIAAADRRMLANKRRQDGAQARPGPRAEHAAS